MDGNGIKCCELVYKIHILMYVLLIRLAPYMYEQMLQLSRLELRHIHSRKAVVCETGVNQYYKTVEALYIIIIGNHAYYSSQRTKQTNRLLYLISFLLLASTV